MKFMQTRNFICILAGTLLLNLLIEKAVAQKVSKQNVYLKNGNQIKGQVKEDKLGNFINIEIDDSISVVIPYEKIKKISGSYDITESLSDRKGFINILETGAIGGRVNESQPFIATYSFHLINGFQFSRHLTTGIGVGFDDLFSISSFPLYLSLRGDMAKSKTTPTYQLDIGHSFIKNKQEFIDSKGGRYVSPAVGVKKYLGRLAWGVSLGYRYQRSTSEYQIWGTRYNEKRTHNSLTFKTSLYF